MSIQIPYSIAWRFRELPRDAIDDALCVVVLSTEIVGGFLGIGWGLKMRSLSLGAGIGDSSPIPRVWGLYRASFDVASPDVREGVDIVKKDPGSIPFVGKSFAGATNPNLPYEDRNLIFNIAFDPRTGFRKEWSFRDAPHLTDNRFTNFTIVNKGTIDPIDDPRRWTVNMDVVLTTRVH